MQGPAYTPSMLASALRLYDARETWTRLHVREHGKPTVAIVVFPSSKKDAEGRPLVHRVRGDGAFCSCDGFQYHRQMCSHVLAVRMDVEQARRRMTRRPKRDETPDVVSAF